MDNSKSSRTERVNLARSANLPEGLYILLALILTLFSVIYSYMYLFAVNVMVLNLVFSARCNIYISRLCYDVSVRLSVRL